MSQLKLFFGRAILAVLLFFAPYVLYLITGSMGLTALATLAVCYVAASKIIDKP